MQISDLKQKFISWLFGLERIKKRLIQITFDCLVACLSLSVAFFIRTETGDFLYRFDVYIGVLIAMPTALSVFAARGQYNNITRYISTEAAYNIAIGSAISCAILLSCILLFELEIPRSVPLIYAMLLFLVVVASRVFIRALDHPITKEKPKNIAVYGTSTDSIQLMKALRKNSNYRVRIVLDDSPSMNGKTIGGVAVSNLAEFAQKIKIFEIKILLIMNPSDIPVIRDEILDVLSTHPIEIKIIPSISSLISDRFEINEMKNIKIEDLLGRETVQHNPELMAKTIAQRTVLVTGAGGSIGSELCRQIILWKPKKLILLDVSEFAIYTLLEELKQHPTNIGIDLIPLIGSVQDREFIEKIFNRFSPDTIYHAAAYKHVPLMEQNVMQCITNNVFGTLNIAELAIAAKVKHFILISTDKAVNPTNFMGASKRLAEIICQTLQIKNKKICFAIVRFGNVLGSSGSVVPRFKKQIETGGPITITHLDVKRYFMTIPEAAQLVIQAGSIAKGGDVFVLDMGQPIKIFDLAKRMAVLSGLQPKLNPKTMVQDGEIAITVTGLRPGEKLFEELSYDKNLMGTIHPQINTTAEIPLKQEELYAILATARQAIYRSDHQSLYQVIAEVAKGVARVDRSSDVFISELDKQPKTIEQI